MKAHRRPVSAAGGGQLSCNSRAGQIKNPPSECSGSYHGRHSYRMGLATTTTAASGRCREELLGQRPARRKCRPRHARMLGAATRGTKQQPTGLIAYPAAQGRAVSGCGSQRMLHALERRSHSADHGPSFASLFPPLAAVSSAAIPVRVKLKIPRANVAATTTVDIPSRWDPRANQSPTGALVAALRTAALSRVVVPSVCFTPWSGVRIPLTTAPASLPCFRRWRRSAQLQFPYGSN